MRGAGTGYPLTFRCHRERLERDWRGGNAALEARHSAVRTGRTRRAPSRGKGHPRKLFKSHEYRCACGHVGWSCHVDVLRLPLGG